MHLSDKIDGLVNVFNAGKLDQDTVTTLQLYYRLGNAVSVNAAFDFCLNGFHNLRVCLCLVFLSHVRFVQEVRSSFKIETQLEILFCQDSAIYRQDNA